MLCTTNLEGTPTGSDLMVTVKEEQEPERGMGNEGGGASLVEQLLELKHTVNNSYICHNKSIVGVFFRRFPAPIVLVSRLVLLDSYSYSYY